MRSAATPHLEERSQADGTLEAVSAVEHVEAALAMLDASPVGVLGTVVLDRDVVATLRAHLDAAVRQITEEVVL